MRTDTQNCLSFFCVLSFLPASPEPPLVFADPSFIKVAVEVLKNAKRPLIIIGKGMTKVL